MDASERDELVGRWLDGTATEEEVARLDALLRGDPDARRALLLAADQDTSLRELMKGGAGERTARKAPSRRLARARRGAPAWAWVLVVLVGVPAAALLLRARPEEPAAPPPPPPTSPFVTPPPPPAPPARPPTVEEPLPPPPPPETAPVETATPLPETPPPAPPVEIPPPPFPEKEKPVPTAELAVLSVEGTIDVKRHDGSKAAAPFTWHDDEPLTSSAAGRLVLADGTRLSLKAGSELALAAAGPTALALTRGEVFCEVPPDGKHRLILCSRTGTIECKGTQFGMALTKAGFAVSVVEGSIEASNKDGMRALKAGEALELQDGKAPGTPRKLDPASLAWRFELDTAAMALPKGARVIFKDDFTQESGWKGTRGPAPLGLAGRFALASVPTTDRGSDFFAEVTSRKDPEGWAVGAHTYLRFRYLAEHFGAKQHWKLQLKKKDETNFGGFVLGLTADRWTVMTLRVTGAAGISDPSARLVAADRVHQIVLLARSEGESAPVGARFFIDDVVLFEAPGDVPSEKISLDPK
ncbi:MAG TPA: FecR domain-containing protein [Planctomycetota bacterium]|nr:FecR domain-containing protein [Planctomycetota bacterium]